MKLITLSKINRILGIACIGIYAACSIINAIDKNWAAALGWGCALLMALNAQRLESSCDSWRKRFWRSVGINEEDE